MCKQWHKQWPAPQAFLTTWQNKQNDLCTQRRRRSPSASTETDQLRSMGSWGLKVSSCGQRGLRSDWADAQADLSLCWVYRSFCWFCCALAHFLFLFYEISTRRNNYQYVHEHNCFTIFHSRNTISNLEISHILKLVFSPIEACPSLKI